MLEARPATRSLVDRSRVVASLIGIAAALAAGYAAGRASSAVPAALPVATRECPAPSTPPFDAEQIAGSLRAAVRAELASLCSLSDAGPAPSGEVAPRRADTARHDPGADQLEREVHDALRRGRWERDDQARLRETLGSFRDPRRETALLQRLSAAINAGELEVAFEGPMF